MTRPTSCAAGAARLTRTERGVETPVAGRWQIPAHQGVELRRETLLRTMLRRGRTTTGALLIGSSVNDLAFELTAEIPTRTGEPEVLHFAADYVVATATGEWRLDGDLTLDGITTHETARLHYQGVYRHGERATAVLELRARVRVRRNRSGYVDLSAGIDADAPAHLLDGGARR